MDAVTLRRATADDHEFFFDLHKITLGPYVEQVWGWRDDDQRAHLRRTIDIDTTQVIVVNGEDVGRLNLAVTDHEVFLGLIEIAPSHQRRGIGSGVVRRVLDDAFAAGRTVRLNVLRVNTSAHRLYRRLGFIEVDTEGAGSPIRVQMLAQPPVTEG